MFKTFKVVDVDEASKRFVCVVPECLAFIRMDLGCLK